MNQQQQAHRTVYILEELLGHAVLFGTRDKVSLRAALASAGVLHVVGSAHDVARASVTSEELGLASVSLVGVDERGIPDLPHLMTSLAILERPAADVEIEVIETLLTHLADDGALLVDIPGGGAGERRIRRLIESLCAGVKDNTWAEQGRLSITARRKSPGEAAPIEHLDEVLPVAVLIPTRNRIEILMEVVVDVLFRQSVPPSLLLILDDAGPGEDQVPDDLWGFVESCTTQPAILRTGGVGKAEALNIGLEHVEQPYVAVVDDDDRLASGALLSLATALESHADWVAVASDAVIIDERGAALGLRPLPTFAPEESLARLMEGCIYLQPGTMFRQAALQKTGGYNARLQRLQDYDQWLKLAALGPIGAIDAPLAMVRRHSGNARNPHLDQLIQLSSIEVMKTHLADTPLEKLNAACVGLPPRMARARALELRGHALARVGMLDEALSDFEAWAEVSPEDPRPFLASLRLHSSGARWNEARAMVSKAREVAPNSPLVRSAAVFVDFHDGNESDAANEARALAAEAPGHLVGLQQHLYLTALGGSDELIEAVESLSRVLHATGRPGAEYLLVPRADSQLPTDQPRT